MDDHNPSLFESPPLTDADFRDYGDPWDDFALDSDEQQPKTPTESHVFRWAADGPRAPLCDFHVPQRPYHDWELFKLDKPYTCPVCHTPITHGVHPARLEYYVRGLLKTDIDEFCQTVSIIAAQVTR